MFDRYRKIFLPGKTGREDWSDDELVKQFRRSGDSQLLAELFQRYTHLVYGVCLKYLENDEASRDAVMDIFEFISVNLHKYEIGNFKNWLYTVSRNHCMMEFREKKKHIKLIRNELEKNEEARMESEHELHLFSEENIPAPTDRMKHALAELDEGQRICLELMYLQEKSYREIADITGYSMNQVKSYIQNGKRNLKLMLNRNDN
jgi:RNA polymerase sigma-70 factor (ECF subfamily)